MVRFGSAVAAAALGVGAALAPAAATAAPSSPFAGTWESTDTDGSHQTLRVSGSGQGALALVYLDEEASLCGGAPARFGGAGLADGDYLAGRVLVVCTPGGNALGQIGVEYWYDGGTDQLVDGFGITWDRT
ncbi:hypothetical protein ACK8HX_04370 [Oryzobacter sp. R7]|uniref:hypothetical protein n=1 Tax=Oryzobacter faecalis TaxID=3388656 RepID=UPI00398D6603